MNRRPGGLEKFQVTDREECGLIIKLDEMFYIVRVPNSSSTKADYQIKNSDVEKVREVLSPDEQIVGFFHTHLARHTHKPSETDLKSSARNPDMLHLVYQPSTRKFTWYGGERYLP